MANTTTFSLSEQAVIQTQQNAAAQNIFTQATAKNPSHTELAVTPDGRRVVVLFGWNLTVLNTDPIFTARYLDGSVCTVPLTSLLFGTGELFLISIRQSIGAGQKAALASIPPQATYASVQSNTPLIVNTDNQTTGFSVGVGATLEISNRVELLSTRIVIPSDAGSATLFIQYYLKY
jgi:hypothetical protein